MIDEQECQSVVVVGGDGRAAGNPPLLQARVRAPHVHQPGLLADLGPPARGCPRLCTRDPHRHRLHAGLCVLRRLRKAEQSRVPHPVPCKPRPPHLEIRKV